MLVSLWIVQTKKTVAITKEVKYNLNYPKKKENKQFQMTMNSNRYNNLPKNTVSIVIEVHNHK
jgi:hypothetical protein